MIKVKGLIINVFCRMCRCFLVISSILKGNGIFRVDALLEFVFFNLIFWNLVHALTFAYSEVTSYVRDV